MTLSCFYKKKKENTLLTWQCHPLRITFQQFRLHWLVSNKSSLISSFNLMLQNLMLKFRNILTDMTTTQKVLNIFSGRTCVSFQFGMFNTGHWTSCTIFKRAQPNHQHAVVITVNQTSCIITTILISLDSKRHNIHDNKFNISLRRLIRRLDRRSATT